MAFHKHETENKTYEKFVERADSVLEAEMELIPTIDYSKDEAYNIAGVGGIFSGTYRLKKLNYNITPTGITVSATGVMIYDSYGNKVDDGYQKGEVATQPKKDTAPVKVKADTTYTVKPGQTLSDIAMDITGNANDWKEIEKANKEMLVSRDNRNANDRGNWIYPNQVLKIPGILVK